MATESEDSVQYFIKDLIKKSDDLAPIMKQLHNNLADVPYQDLYMLRHKLLHIQSSIRLLDQFNQEMLAEKKTKRRFNPFKK